VRIALLFVQAEVASEAVKELSCGRIANSTYATRIAVINGFGGRVIEELANAAEITRHRFGTLGIDALSRDGLARVTRHADHLLNGMSIDLVHFLVVVT
jgi:hypothetical protein